MLQKYASFSGKRFNKEIFMGSHPEQPKRDVRANSSGFGSGSGRSNSQRNQQDCPTAFTTTLTKFPQGLELKKGDQLKIEIKDDVVNLLYQLILVASISGKVADRLIHCDKKGINYTAKIHKVDPYVIAFLRN